MILSHPSGQCEVVKRKRRRKAKKKAQSLERELAEWNYGHTESRVMSIQQDNTIRELKTRIAELEGLCKDWARWAMGFQHLGAIGRDILERTDKALRGESDL